jgi:hypothetical protein
VNGQTEQAQERESLELRLREMLDDDDAVSAVQLMLAAGWLPPGEVAARLRQAEQRNEIMREALEWYSREGTGGYMKAQAALARAYDAAKEQA